MDCCYILKIDLTNLHAKIISEWVDLWVAG